MKLNVLVLIAAIFPILLQTCPTCIGLPRPGERPFFERKAFLSIIQESEQKPQKPSHNQQKASAKILNKSDKSDTPAQGGGLMSVVASKAIG